jgi:hypothetical protein
MQGQPMSTSDAAVPTFTFRELTIWRTKLLYVEHAAVLPLKSAA